MKRHCGLHNLQFPIGQPGTCNCNWNVITKFESKTTPIVTVANELFATIENNTYLTEPGFYIDISSINKTKSYILIMIVDVFPNKDDPADAVLFKPVLYNTLTGLVDMSFFDFREAECIITPVLDSGICQMISITGKLDTSILSIIPDFYQFRAVTGAYRQPSHIIINHFMELIEV